MKSRLFIIILAVVTIGASSSLLLLFIGDDSNTPDISLQESEEKILQKTSPLTPASFVVATPDDIVQQLISLTNDDGDVKKTFDNGEKSVYTT